MTLDTSAVPQSQRLEIIGTVASGIAHDLNNQLAVILGHLDLAVRQLPAYHPVRASLLDVQRAASRCTEMTGSLLDFSNPAEPRLRPMDLTSVLAETARLLRRVLPAAIHLSFSLDPGLMPVVADGTQIQQVVINLALNARDAMQQGGELEISARNAQGAIVLTVRDTGCGIPIELQSRIFEPFFTTRTESGGTGLGLAMVSAIVKSHGGELTVKSETGKGSTFELTLPAN